MRNFFFITFLLFSTLSFSQSDYALANDYYRKAEYEKAIPHYEKLLQRNPFNSFYIKRIITCYQEIDRFDLAENYIRSSLEVNPSNTFWYVELGYNFQRQQKDSLANMYYQKAIESVKVKPSMGGLTGRFFRENNLLNEAIKAYELAMQYDESADFNFQLARIYGEQGSFDKMFKAYIDLVDNNDSYIGTVQRYTSSYITDDPNNKYNLSFKKALLRKSISNPKIVWNEFLSWLFSQQGEFNKAFVQEKAIYFKKKTGNLSNLFVLGKLAFDSSSKEDAETIFSFVLENAIAIEEKLEAELFLLRLAVANDTKNIEQLFENKLAQYGYNVNTIHIQKAYADFLTFQLNQPEKAVKILDKALTLANSKFERARIKLKLGEVLVFTGKFNKALIYFSHVQIQLKNHPLGQEARFKVAETSFFKGDFSWAKAQLKVLKGSTTQLIANDAVNLFLTVSDNEPRDSFPTGLKEYAKGKLLAYQNKKQSAVNVFLAILKEYQGQNIEDETHFELAKLYIQTNQFENAITHLNKIIDMDKNGVFVDDAYYLLAETYKNHLKDVEKASEYYQKIIFDYASSIYLVDARKKFRQLRGDSLN